MDQIKKQELSIKNELILLIITIIALIILNVASLEKSTLGIIANLMVICVSGYGFTLLIFSHKEDLSVSSRLILTPIIGIFLIALWSFLISYGSLKYLYLQIEYLAIIILALTFLMRILRSLNKWRRNRKSITDEKIEKETDKDLKKVQKPTQNLLELVKLKKSSRNLFLLLLITLLSIIAIFTPSLYTNNFNTLKTPLIILLMFFIPGYTILSSIFLSFSEQKWIKKILYSIGLSILIFLSLGAIMTLIKWSINSKIILGIIITISLLTAVFGYLRRRKKQKQLKKASWYKEIPQIEKEKLEGLKLSLEHKDPKEEIKIGIRSEIHSILVSNWFKFTLVIILSLIGIIINWVPSLENTIMRAIFMIPLIFFLPGYALKELILSKKFKGIKATVFISISLSIILTIMLGSLLTLLYPNSYHDLCITLLSLISLFAMLVLVLKIRRSRNISPLKEKYPDRTIELEKELSKKAQQKALQEKLDYKLLKSDVKEEVPSTEPKSYKSFEEKLRKSFPQQDYFQPEEQKKVKKTTSRKKSTSKLSFLSNDLFLIVLLTLITLVSIYTPALGHTPLREITGLLFVLFIPGYVLIAALFPKRKDLDSIERLALSFGLSLAIAPLIGLALNYTPWGIRLTPIVISLTALTVILIVITLIRRRKLPKEERFSPQFAPYFNTLKKSFHQESRVDKILSVVLIISLILAVSTTVYIVVKPKQGEKFTEFYILGPNGKASDYPTNLTVNENAKIILGIVNHEYSNVTYRYIVKLQNTTITDAKVTLKNNQTWEKDLIFAPTVSGANQKLEFILYKLPDQKKPYRTLHLWIDVT